MVMMFGAEMHKIRSKTMEAQFKKPFAALQISKVIIRARIFMSSTPHRFYLGSEVINERIHCHYKVPVDRMSEIV